MLRRALLISHQFGFLVLATAVVALAVYPIARPGKRTGRETQLSGSSATAALQSQTLNAGLWRVDRTFNSTIHIKNSLVVSPLNVVPVLYMADGTRYVLAPVTLPTAGVIDVNVNDALRAAPPEVAAHVSDYGSAAIEYQNAIAGAVSASLEILDIPRSLIFTYYFGPSGGAVGPYTVEGVWWRHDPEVRGFVALTNTTSRAVEVRLVVLGANGSQSPEKSFRLDPHTVKIQRMEEMWEMLPPGAREKGGLQVQYTGAAGDILVSAGLQNDAIGYSATLPFLMKEAAPIKQEPRTYASVGLMAGKPDPMNGFPPTTRFFPYAVIRNTTGDRLPVSSSIVYTSNGQPVTVSLPLTSLRPFSTERLDLRSLMTASGLGSFDGMINLTFTFNGRPGDLLIATGTVDQTGTYVFEVGAEAARKCTGKEIAFWSVAGGSDTMISLWNPLDVAQDMAVTFYYADGSGQYWLPVHLTPNADTMISVEELKMMARPDPDGRIFSATPEEGSATVTNLADAHGEFTVVVSAGTFNVRTATCGGPPPCHTCIGMTGLQLSGPAAVPVGNTATYQLTATYSNGTVSHDPALAVWSSSNSTVASVNAAGVVTAKASGSAVIDAFVGDAPLGGYCSLPPTYDGGCGLTASFDASVGVSVQVPTSLKFLTVSVLPDGSTGAFGCPPSNNYGIRVDIKYQVLDQNSNPIASAAMVPHETGTLFGGTAFDNDIGPVGGFPTSSKTTASDGTFHDVPFGYCQNTPINTERTATQNIQIVMSDGTRRPVRSQTWSVIAPGSASFGHGSIKNTITSPGTGSDVSASR